ncbi:transglutaminase-like domain-containing protein [Mycoplasmopsis pullorum]|nr:transglutaminase-like domain-containing protein [Mycoplasmopsis pullorum]TNK88074.1 hypothetical protein C4M89_03730 [Mycoplasmopsis pullorum]TNK91781.1 hypothetical protein C4M96_03435 [Mycoplasmopsis pullorum]
MVKNEKKPKNEIPIEKNPINSKEPDPKKRLEKLKKEVWESAKKVMKNEEYSTSQENNELFGLFLKYFPKNVDEVFLVKWKNDFIFENDNFEETYQNNNEFHMRIKYDYLVYKLEKLKEFWTTPEHLYSQIEARLGLFLKVLKGETNYFDQDNKRWFLAQWGVDNQNNWGLNPEKFYSNNFNWIYLDPETIFKIIDEYEKWKWVKVEPDSNPNRYKNIKFEKLVTSRNPIIKKLLKQDENFIFIENYTAYSFISKTDEEIEKILNEDKTYDKYQNRSELEKKYWNFTKNINFWKNSFIQKRWWKNKELFEKIRANTSFDKINFDKFYNYNPTTKEEKLLGTQRMGSSSWPELFYEKPNIFVGLSKKGQYSMIKVDENVNNKIENNTKISEIIPIRYDENKKLYYLDYIKKYQEWRQKWEEILPKIIDPNWSDEQKIKAISFFIISNVTYNNTNQRFGARGQYTYDGYGFMTPFALFERDKELRCNGYAQNFAMAMSLLGIPVRQLGGDIYEENSLASSGQHAWNEVFVDGRWKVVDLTWADKSEEYRVPEPENTKYSEINLDYVMAERNDPIWNTRRLFLDSYISTIFKYKNPQEYEYVDLPEYFTNTPEEQPTWEEWVNSDRNLDIDIDEYIGI